MVSDILRDKVLVLNKMFFPLCTVDVQRALYLIFTGKALVMGTDWVTYTLEEWTESNLKDLHRAIRTTKTLYIAPEVIRLTDYDQIFDRGLNLTRQNVYLRDGFECAYCGSKSNLTIDHVIPKSRMKEFKLDPKFIHSWLNLVTCCSPCNAEKGDKSLEEIGFKLKFKPKKPTGISFKLKKAWKPSWSTFVKD